MKIAQLYTYPIKSLRAHALQDAELTRHGFRYDRRFMLLQVLEDDTGSITYENMHVSGYNEMVLFSTELHMPSAAGTQDGSITVTHKPSNNEAATISIPLEPAVQGLAVMDVEMHKSPTTAYNMGPEYNDWFSARFGFTVVLAYLGGYRPIRMSRPHGEMSQQASGLVSSLTNAAMHLLGGRKDADDKELTFADCAPYLVVSERSMDDVHNRLPDGQRMDITKFRPNIVVSGAGEPWEEDYWAELTINDTTKIECIHNCVRCMSINVDYATGKQGKAADGKMLAKLSKDRRVDPGGKYSPVFGRYSFLHGSSEGQTIRVGDDVVVSKVNQERTKFGWWHAQVPHVDFC